MLFIGLAEGLEGFYENNQGYTMSSDLALLVISCDKYSYVWPAFFQLLNYYWRDCPFKIYLLSNYETSSFVNVENILVGRDLSWSDNVIKGLEKITEENVLIFLEDELLTDHVDNKFIIELFNWFSVNNANCLRLNPSPKPDRPINQDLGIASKGTIYRVSTVLTLWKKRVLASLLVPGENAWEFETRGTLRSNVYDHFYSARNKTIKFENAIIKGKWQRSGINVLKRNGIQLKEGHIIPMKLHEELIHLMKRARSKILYLFPPKYRLAIKKYVSNKRWA